MPQIRRSTAPNGNLVAADFNNDGIVDLAATGGAAVSLGHAIVVALGKASRGPATASCSSPPRLAATDGSPRASA
jgi:hypothetical protein